jgi:N6-L-threonylcarbamoyladenine synthase
MAENGISEGLLGCSMENNDLFCHISGAESQVQRWMIVREPYPQERIAREIYDFLARISARMLIAGSRLTGLHTALVTGGIASSELFREMLYSRSSGKREMPEIIFGQPEMSGDNAVGVAKIGLKRLKNPG